MFLWTSPGAAIPWGSKPHRGSKSSALGDGRLSPQDHDGLRQETKDSTRNWQAWLTGCTYPLAPSSLVIGMQFLSFHPEDSLDLSQETHPIQHGLKFKHLKDTPQVKYCMLYKTAADLSTCFGTALSWSHGVQHSNPHNEKHHLPYNQGSADLRVSQLVLRVCGCQCSAHKQKQLSHRPSRVGKDTPGILPA